MGLKGQEEPQDRMKPGCFHAQPWSCKVGTPRGTFPSLHKGAEWAAGASAHWDKNGKSLKDSSCFLGPASLTAKGQWGSLARDGVCLLSPAGGEWALLGREKTVGSRPLVDLTWSWPTQFPIVQASVLYRRDGGRKGDQSSSDHGWRLPKWSLAGGGGVGRNSLNPGLLPVCSETNCWENPVTLKPSLSLLNREKQKPKQSPSGNIPDGRDKQPVGLV